MIYSPSLMCTSCDNLKTEVQNLEAAGATRLHLDVMDGQYVPNFALGLGDIKSVCRNTSLVTELHLMIYNPGRYIKLFADAGVDIIYFHPDADDNPQATIKQIRERGLKPGIAINPETTIESLQKYYSLVDHVLVMGVKPGHAGHLYLPHVDQKLKELIDTKNKYHLEIIMDGACSLERMVKWSKHNVDGFVLGTSSLFGHRGSYKDIIDNIKRECGE